MKILAVTPVFPPSIGGMEQVIYDLAIKVRQFGSTMDIAHLAPSFNTLQEENLDGLRVFRVPLRGNYLLGVAPALKSLLQNYDLLHVHDHQMMAITANVLLFRGNVPAVLSTHGGFWHTKRLALLKKLYEKLFLRWALSGYQRILASSTGDFDYFSRYTGKIHLCGNGVNTDKFASAAAEKNRSPLQWIYWGRLSRNKRVDQVIDLVAQARSLGYAVDFLICGADYDGLLDSFKQQVERLNLGNQVRFIPHLGDEALLQALRRRGVFITASEHEGFGLSIVEAMAAGLIVLCRDMPPINRFVSAGQSGFFLNFDGGALDRERLKQLFSWNGELMTQASHRAGQLAAPYGWDQVTPLFIRHFEQALNEARQA
jgi:alpha-1,3-mannosyltransferase